MDWAKQLRKLDERGKENGTEFRATDDVVIQYENWIPLDPEEVKIVQVLLDAGFEDPPHLRRKRAGWS